MLHPLRFFLCPCLGSSQTEALATCIYLLTCDMVKACFSWPNGSFSYFIESLSKSVSISTISTLMTWSWTSPLHQTLCCLFTLQHFHCVLSSHLLSQNTSFQLALSVYSSDALSISPSLIHRSVSSAISLPLFPPPLHFSQSVHFLRLTWANRVCVYLCLNPNRLNWLLVIG